MSDAEKKARLAEALRANLRRRKAQARGQSSENAAREEDREREDRDDSRA